MPSPSISVQQLTYSSHPRISMSDHRPVAADFAVEVRLASLFCVSVLHRHPPIQMPVIDSVKLESTAHTLYNAVSSIDPNELEDMPTLKLTTTFVDMGVVSYVSSSYHSLMFPYFLGQIWQIRVPFNHCTEYQPCEFLVGQTVKVTLTSLCTSRSQPRFDSTQTCLRAESVSGSSNSVNLHILTRSQILIG